jgi:predicted RNA-binding protein YlxR (DUF448 family)
MATALKHEPVRTCVACRREGLKADLVRLVRGADGAAAVDRTGHAPGRGAYLHRDPACIDLARRRRQVERALGATAHDGLWAEVASV